MADYIRILEDNDPYWWRPKSDGKAMDARLQLRVLSDDEVKELRKKNTKTVFRQHQRDTETDSGDVAADILDQAILAWEGIVNARTGADLPCERRYKLLLPEWVKVEVIRQCAGKEAGSVVEANESKKS